MNPFDFRAMGSQVRVFLEEDPEQDASRIEQVPAWFEAWEQTFSRFRSDSELNRLNRSDGEPMQVSQVLFKVLSLALDVERRSGGLVTPTVLKAVEMAGYTSSFEALPADRWKMTSQNNSSSYGMEDVILDPRTRGVILPSGIGLDFGGIVKGWAGWQTMLRVEDLGPVLVDAGGDLAVSGPCSGGNSWEIGVYNPFNPDVPLASIRMGRGGVATSGRDRRRWQKNGSWQHHIIDPRSGLPAQTDVLNATVTAPNLVDAEMGAKVALILGSREGMAWIEDHPRLAGMVVLADGRVLTSSRLRPMLVGSLEYAA